MKTAGLYASYDFGAVKLMTQFEKGDNSVSADDRLGRAEKIKAFSVGLTAPVGAFLVRAGYLRINSDLLNVPSTTAGQGDGAKFGLGADYNLSKRTNLYASFGKWSGDRFNAATKKGRLRLRRDAPLLICLPMRSQRCCEPQDSRPPGRLFFAFAQRPWIACRSGKVRVGCRQQPVDRQSLAEQNRGLYSLKDIA